jgi:hypothetical protein
MEATNRELRAGPRRAYLWMRGFACKVLLFLQVLKYYANHVFLLAVHLNHLHLKQNRNCNELRNRYFHRVACKILSFMQVLKSYANLASRFVIHLNHLYLKQGRNCNELRVLSCKLRAITADRFPTVDPRH